MSLYTDKVKTVNKNSAGTPTGATPKTTLTLQNIQELIQESNKDITEKLQISMQDIINKNFEQLNLQIKTELGEIKETLNEFKGNITENTQKIKTIEEKTEAVETKYTALEEQLTTRNNELQGAVLQLELEKSEYYLRLQNVGETREEDLTQLITEIFAGLGINKNYVRDNIEEVYRIYTNYIKKNRLPGEIHIKFLRKSIRDEILRKARDTTISFKGQEITILKQVPKKIRESRRTYQFLTRFLQENSIRYRWLIPEGLLITRFDKKIRIETIEEAKEFIRQESLVERRRDKDKSPGKERQEKVNIQGAEGGINKVSVLQENPQTENYNQTHSGVETRSRGKR